MLSLTSVRAVLGHTTPPHRLVSRSIATARIKSPQQILSRLRPIQPPKNMALLTIIPSIMHRKKKIDCSMSRRLFATSSTTSSPTVADENPILALQLFPDFVKIRPSHIVPAFDALVQKCSEEFETCEARFAPSWEMTMGLTEEIDDVIERCYGVVSHLNMVKDSPDLRAAIETIQPRVIQLCLRMSQSQPKYQALKQLRDGPTWSSLSPEQQRIVHRTLADMELMGVGLTDTRHRFNEITERLSQLSIRFGNNVLDATKAFVEVVHDREQLRGCSEQLLQMMSKNAQKRGFGEGDKENGPWAVTLDQPVFGPFMMFCQNRALREKVYRAHITRASEGDWNNVPIINEILELKQEQAALLGFPNYAALSLSSKMAGRIPNAQQLITDLYNASLEHAKRDLAKLERFAVEQLQLSTPLQPWDISYVSEAYRKHLFRFDEEQIQQYFAFPRVINGLFALAEEIFGVKIREVHGEPMKGWHDDVRLYEVSSLQGGETLAYFYGDFYSRPEEKKSGAWMDISATRRRMPDGSVRVPVAYLICNQQPPASPEQPSLMKFRDVETLFHEFGHCLQHMLTRVEYPQASGIKMIEWDFVEVASQLMENFCHEPRWLARLAQHHVTGEAMPAEMVSGLVKAREFLAGIAMIRQLHFAQLDLTLHSNFKPPRSPGDKTVFDVDLELARQTAVLPRLPEDRFLCSFSHIFAGGYSAGYYSYKWSEVYSADAYAAFEAAGPERTREVGKRYRETVLALGGATDPREVWRKFRGRETADIAPLLRHSGLLDRAHL
ncbi:uncharacterized protein VTP21DRAFT_9824 [Calcarisporiella thermophila]|uniref:uncharacterized protein n=1 Tax=Calcarisporiella thermophila TaxID=911321 RepID=UPI0037438A00